MKKIFLFIALTFIMCVGCTSNSRARYFGGTMTINLPAGQELMEATWKDNDLFYLTRPMSSDYVPVTKTFQESSQYGVVEGTVIFVESR